MKKHLALILAIAFCGGLAAFAADSATPAEGKTAAGKPAAVMRKVENNKISSMVGEIRITGELRSWNLEYSTESPEPGLELIRLSFHAPKPSDPPHIRLEWSVPQLDMQFRWHPGATFQHNIPRWGAGSQLASSLASIAPVVLLGSLDDKNHLCFSVSEALRTVKLQAGVLEATNAIGCSIELFSNPEAPLADYETVVRIDTRKLFYADTLRQTFHWFEEFPECAPGVAVPPAAFEPIYSSWYSFHRQLSDREIEAECRLAASYGMKGIIVDDGWQSDNGGYDFCGDWEISKNKFPDMRAHVAKIHKLGMKYMIWYAVPFIGRKSRNVERFRGKYLYEWPGFSTYVLDPRFPEVREFLISTYEKALREWDIDGFKLDFIDLFRCVGEDPARKENYAGRDIKFLPEAVDRLLSEAMVRLNRIKPGILIEFRQPYIGPAIRKYGSMFRASDCPADVLSNRVRTIDLRLSSGATAVHSDMLEWNTADSAETAALQFLNVLFAVPQISVKIEEIPERHREMLRFWIGFWVRHRETLMHGTLRPLHPSLNYPIVIADGADEQIVAVYSRGMTVPVDCAPGRRCLIVNASGAEELVLNLTSRPVECESVDVTGQTAERVTVESAGLVQLRVPRSGVLSLRF